jgi:hypothetical protein
MAAAVRGVELGGAAGGGGVGEGSDVVAGDDRVPGDGADEGVAVGGPDREGVGRATCGRLREPVSIRRRSSGQTRVC